MFYRAIMLNVTAHVSYQTSRRYLHFGQLRNLDHYGTVCVHFRQYEHSELCIMIGWELRLFILWLGAERWLGLTAAGCAAVIGRGVTAACGNSVTSLHRLACWQHELLQKLLSLVLAGSMPAQPAANAVYFQRAGYRGTWASSRKSRSVTNSVFSFPHSVSAAWVWEFYEWVRMLVSEWI